MRVIPLQFWAIMRKSSSVLSKAWVGWRQYVVTWSGLCSSGGRVGELSCGCPGGEFALCDGSCVGGLIGAGVMVVVDNFIDVDDVSTRGHLFPSDSS